MPGAMQAGELLADRYRLEDLLTESRGGRFWRATDTVLDRPVAVHVIPRDDERADGLVEAARLVGPLSDRRILRVLDAEVADDACYVVNEWGQGVSLDILIQREGPQPPRKVAWLVSEVAEALAHAHHKGLAHGRLVPENVLIDDHGHVRIIGFGVDAALMGLPPGRRSADVTDLVSLLYFSLTGKWPGVSKSAMPPAPLAHGHVLRPRQVRAGIPRPLDALCDQVLNPVGVARSPRFEQDLTTALGICEVLLEFLGDPTPVGNGTAHGTAAQPTDPPTDAQQQQQTTFVGPVEPPAPAKAPPQAPTPASADLPTQAGMPVFHDDSDDVEWLRARSEKPAPPPPLEEIPAKPLFAPEPPEGQPQRRPRAGARPAAADSGFWPWDSSSAGQSSSGIHAAGHTGSWGTGSWGTGSWGVEETFDEPDDRVPGRSWIRLAMIVGLLALVLVAAVAAYQFGLPDPDPEPPAPSTGTSQSPASPQPFTDITATDFDPQGDPPREEYPELVPLAFDGDPSTVWRTSTYKQDFGPAGLKTGVGLVLDLGATKGVREIEVTTVGGETGVAVYVTGTPPTGVADLTPVGTALGEGVLTVALDEAVSGRYVTVWLTSLPEVDGGFRGTIAEVQVRG